MPDTPEPSRLRTTEEILAKAEEYAAIFESDAFDPVWMTPEEYAAARHDPRRRRTAAPTSVASLA